MSRNVDHFSRGRDAYTEKRPCFCDDARLSGKARNAWYEGWKHQRNLNTQPAAAEAQQAAISGLGEILAKLKSLP